MNDEAVKVTLTSETQSRLQQWGRGLLYRDDARKRTLESKSLLIAAGLGFASVTVFLLLQSSPELAAPASSRSGIPTPGDTAISQEQVNIPEIATQENGYNGQTATQRRGSGAATTHAVVKYRGPQIIKRPRTVKIPPGSMVKAVLISGASNGPVRVEISESLSVGGETVIPQGTILLGTGQSGDNRLMLQFNQMVFQDGAVETVEAQGCDPTDKIAGLKGSRVGSQAMKLAMGIGLNFVGGMSDALQDSSAQNGAVIRAPSLKNAMLNGAATAALDQSREIMSDSKNRPPVWEIAAGTPLFILFQKD